MRTGRHRSRRERPEVLLSARTSGQLLPERVPSRSRHQLIVAAGLASSRLIRSPV